MAEKFFWGKIKMGKFFVVIWELVKDSFTDSF